MFRCLFLFVAVFGVLSASPAQARRAALIIANSTYAHTAYLPNPKSDSQLVAQAVRKAGFDDVTVVTDLTKAGFDQALREFRTHADGADVALIYFAGHGIESAGVNYVIPTDATLQETRDLRFEAIELDGLLETLNNAQLRIVILDACRNNPFGSQWRSSVRSVSKGLAEPERVEGALVIFAAAGGQVATDGVGANSPFAQAVANRLPEPGLSIHRLGSVIREDVANATGGKQTPWTNTSIGGEEYVLVKPAGAEPVAQAVPAPAPSGYDPGFDALLYNNARRLNTVEAYQGYINRFPNGLFIDEAQAGIARLRGVGAQPAERPAPAPPAAAPTVAVVAPVSPRPAVGGGAPEVGPRTMPVDDADQNSVAVVTANANTVHDRAALPAIPPAPRFSAEAYPKCREDFQAAPTYLAKAQKINDCLSALAMFFEGSMNGYARAMIDHQEQLSRLYTDKVANNPLYSPESQQRFHREMLAEHAASKLDGANAADYRAARDSYERDRAYLQDQYCRSTGACGGYPVPRDAKRK